MSKLIVVGFKKDLMASLHSYTGARGVSRLREKLFERTVAGSFQTAAIACGRR